MASIINSLAVPSSYRDQLYQVRLSFLKECLSLTRAFRDPQINSLTIYQQQPHFMLVIYPFSQQKSKYTNYLENVERSNVSLWALIVTKRHLVGFAL